jgi:hypothetical protein
LPSGEKAIVQTQPPWPARDFRGRPVAASQSRTSLSLPLASVVLSGEKASAETLNGWPFSWCRSLPVARSQIRICLSAPAEASSLPSGERAAAYASHSVWPARVRIRFPDFTSKTPTSLSMWKPAAARVRPSGEKPTPRSPTSPITRRSAPVFAS